MRSSAPGDRPFRSVSSRRSPSSQPGTRTSSSDETRLPGLWPVSHPECPAARSLTLIGTSFSGGASAACLSGGARAARSPPGCDGERSAPYDARSRRADRAPAAAGCPHPPERPELRASNRPSCRRPRRRNPASQRGVWAPTAGRLIRKRSQVRVLDRPSPRRPRHSGLSIPWLRSHHPARSAPKRHHGHTVRPAWRRRRLSARARRARRSRARGCPASAARRTRAGARGRSPTVPSSGNVANCRSASSAVSVSRITTAPDRSAFR
jgi:hypothetical protein